MPGDRYKRSTAEGFVLPRLRWIGVVLLAGSLHVACGGSPVAPPPPPRPDPVNSLPVIDGITIQGRRTNQPARMADIGETVDVAATVRDTETALDELVYEWTATAGTITGTGRVVTWKAPATDPDPTFRTGATVTLTLKVTERYGHPGEAKTFSQQVSGTQTLALHDSIREVGDMSRNFLTLFSTTDIKDADIVMADFNRSVCPRPDEVDSERDQVRNHYTNYRMNAFTIDPAMVTINFGGRCDIPDATLPGDACASVRVMWDSTGPPGRIVTTGVDLLTAVFSVPEDRWWLCSSRFDNDSTFGHSFYDR